MGFVKKTPETSLKISQLTFPKDISPLSLFDAKNNILIRNMLIVHFTSKKASLINILQKKKGKRKNIF